MKLGVHTQRVTEAGLAWARVAPLVKVLPDDARALDVADPRAIKIFRLNPNPPLEEDGALVIDRTLDMLGEERWDYPNLYLQILNEENQYLGQGLERRVEQHREAKVHLVAFNRMLEVNIGLVGYGFSVGNPGEAEWQYLKSMGWGHVDRLGTNAYWPKQGDENWADYLWTALRHRIIHEWTEGDHPNIIITECGVDAVLPWKTGSLPGWKANGLTPEQFVGQLKTFERYLKEDAYVDGAVVFLSGAYL